MPKNFISNSSDSVRMFKSNFLEHLSKVHYSVPLIIYVPIVLYFSIKDFLVNKEGLFSFSGFFLLGLLVWSFTEYILHRFLFHFIPKSSWGSRLHFIFHGVHHDYPNDAKRLVMPPISQFTSCYFVLLFIFTVPLNWQPLCLFPRICYRVSGV